jgi:hypothetical protein
VLTVISIVSWLMPRRRIDQTSDIRKSSERKANEIRSAAWRPDLLTSVVLLAAFTIAFWAMPGKPG